jgi:hypothetical protein
MNKFEKGDKVIQVGTKQPIMEVKGVTLKPSNPDEPYHPDGTYTCYWQANGPNWKAFNESELEIFSKTK